MIPIYSYIPVGQKFQPIAVAGAAKMGRHGDRSQHNGQTLGPEPAKYADPGAGASKMGRREDRSRQNMQNQGPEPPNAGDYVRVHNTESTKMAKWQILLVLG